MQALYPFANRWNPNIGTTFSSQLIALDIGQYSPIPIFLGLVFSFPRMRKFPKTARVVLLFSILFFTPWKGLLNR